MNCWTYQGECFLPEHIQPSHYGFVYRITCIGGEYPGFFYIGSKAFNHFRTRKLSKKRADELYTLKGRRGGKQRKEKVVIPAKWLEYSSSSKTLKELVDQYGRDSFRFEILEFATSKSDLLYKEACQMIGHRVMTSPRSFNECFAFRIYKKQLLK